MDKEFNEYMNFFKEQSKSEKEKIVYDQLYTLAGITNKICTEYGIKNELILSNDLVSVKNGNYTDDEYLNALIVLINSIQNSICDFSDSVSDLVDRISEE